MADPRDPVTEFLAGTCYAVVGASRDRAKFGNRVLRAYLAHGREAIPVHPSEHTIEGQPCVASLARLPRPVHGVSIVTPPEVTQRVVEEALALGLRRLWMQPGAEHPAAVERARAAGALVLAYGPCLLVEIDA
ncbi:MAG: CoA-binding protein [Planctomycetia bacterium]